MILPSTDTQITQLTTLDRLRARWHPTLNGDADVMAMKSYDNERVWWLGECGHEWDSSPVSLATSLRRGSSGCPVCTGKKVVAGVNDLASQYAAIAREWHPTLNGELTAQQVTGTSNKDYWWLCPQGHDWHTKVSSRTVKGVTCKICSNLELLTGFNDIATTHPALATEWHPAKNGDRTAETTRGNERQKAWWQCDQGHEWFASPAMRTTASTGCPACGNRLTIAGTNDLVSTHPHLLAELESILPDRNGKVWAATEVTQGSDLRASWKCSVCSHRWDTSIRSRATDGTGCDKCARKENARKAAMPSPDSDVRSTHPHLIAQWHPTRNEEAEMPPLHAGSSTKYWWQCEKGHAWKTSVIERSNGSGCSYCSGHKTQPGFNDLASNRPDLASEWHPTKNAPLSATDVTAGSGKTVWWECTKCSHSWTTTPALRTGRGRGCPQCAANKRTWVSAGETEVANFIRSLFPNETMRTNAKGVIGNRQDLDIYLPDRGFAVEYNGIYHHSEAFKRGRDYHKNKWQVCRDLGIQLVQIWSDEWERNPEQVKRMLAHKLGQPYGNEPKIMARKTVVGGSSKKEVEEFFEEHHIQGFAAGTYYLTLQEKASGKTVAVLILRKEAGTGGKALNIIRYATSAVVPGGFTKLLKHAERAYQPEKFITFSDNCVSDGGLYKNNGFVADKELPPDYMYVVRNERKHKFGYRLKRFKNDPKLKWEEGRTEKELAALNGLNRVWDAGKTRWVKVLKDGNTTPSSDVTS